MLVNTHGAGGYCTVLLSQWSCQKVPSTLDVSGIPALPRHSDTTRSAMPRGGGGGGGTWCNSRNYPMHVLQQ